MGEDIASIPGFRRDEQSCYPPPMIAERVVCSIAELPPGKTRKFNLAVAGRDEECFVVNYDGKLFAWVNRCLHVAMTMDWVENRFFSEDGRFIVCATHGACYLPDTGECVEGPPLGKSLIPVRIEVRDGAIVASYSDGE